MRSATCRSRPRPRSCASSRSASSSAWAATARSASTCACSPTNQDLESRVKAGTFREDLYYRLNVVGVALPSLRERPEDLPLLIEHFLAAAAGRLGRGPKTLASAAYRALLAHEWKGNVRELEHAIEQAVVLASAPEIELEDLPPAGASAAPRR